MIMRLLSILIIISLMSLTFYTVTYADSIAVLKQGLIGAGTGAVATAMSGSKGNAVWKGALIGAGVTVVGGALLDVLTGERVGNVTYVSQAQSANYVMQPQQVTYVTQAQPVRVITPMVSPMNRARPNSIHRRIYRQGFRNGYNQGYQDGYEDASYGVYVY